MKKLIFFSLLILLYLIFSIKNQLENSFEGRTLIANLIADRNNEELSLDSIKRHIEQFKLEIRGLGSKFSLLPLILSITPDFEEEKLRYTRELQSDYQFVPCEIPLGTNKEGIDALISRNINDYISTSRICINNHFEKKVDEISILWRSLSSLPDTIKIELYDTDQNKIKEIIKGIQTHPLMGNIVSKILTTDMPPFSRIHLSFYRKGESNRVSIRKVLLSELIESGSSIQALASRISKLKPYGEGVRFSFAMEDRESVLAYRKLLDSSPTFHCGNYAFLFVSNLPPHTPWTIYGLKNNLGIFHTLVEIKDSTGNILTVDPTLGTTIECSIQDLIAAKCPILKIKPKDTLIMNTYQGYGFLYKASIISTQSSN